MSQSAEDLWLALRYRAGTTPSDFVCRTASWIEPSVDGSDVPAPFLAPGIGMR